MEILLAYVIFLTLPKIILSILELNFLKIEKTKTPYILEKEQFIKAANYSIKSEKLSLIGNFIDLALMAFWLLYGFAFLNSWLESLGYSPLFKSVIFVLSFLVVSSIVSLPLSAYKVLILDKEFGFAKGGVKLFIMDTLKEFLLLIILGGILVFAFSWIILNVAFWEFYAFILLVVLMIGANVIYPSFIMPLFNKFTPLENIELKDSINTLLNRVGFKSEGVFVMDASKRDGRLNAFFAGIGKSKRVVLFDTLLEKISKDSILAVLGHELGHFKHYDLYKMMALMFVFFGVLLFFVANIPQSLFDSINLEVGAHSLIICLLILSAPLQFYYTPLISLLSRKNEFGADKFGASLTSKESLANALLLLVKENNSFPLAHPLYLRFYYSHPPLMERLKALDCANLALK
ncbi:MAG: M48 family metallopeptidase [Helicobacteraceae bacterium]|nr:M48 family metallopeptidase [Helicobacteraceae bacterium]